MGRRRTRQQEFFTIEQANATLPLVRAIVRDLVELSREVGERRRRLSMLLGGHNPDSHDPYREELIQVQQELRKDARRLEEYVGELEELGVDPASGAEGFVDFPALIDGRRVSLCWKLGEPEVLNWHERGPAHAPRQPLTAMSAVEGEYSPPRSEPETGSNDD